MTSERSDTSTTTVLDSIRGTRDALSVRRVFGDPVALDGVTVIPVARLAGGAGGGGGEGARDEETGSGFGSGFGLHARPVGVYVICDGKVDWKPTIDVTKLAHSSQVLAGIIAVCLTLVAIRHPRRAGA